MLNRTDTTQTLIKNIFGTNKNTHFLNENELNISYFKITKLQANKLSELIKKDKVIKKIIFNKIDISDESLETIFIAMSTNQYIKEFVLHEPNGLINNKWINALKYLLKINTKLANLSLTKCSIVQEEIKIIASGLIDNNTLQSLNLEANLINPSAATLLVYAININQKVLLLNLSNNIINNDLESFGLAIASNHSLTHLILRNNDINDLEIKYLGHHLKNNTTLKCLHLENNLYSVNQKSHEILKTIFQKKYWMDTITTNALRLTRTYKERMIQLEKESPVQDGYGNKILLCNIEFLFKHHRYIFEGFAQSIENSSDNHPISFANLFQLFNIIYREDKSLFELFNTKTISTLFVSPSYFFELFILLKQLNLINENNFKIYYFLIEENKQALYSLFNKNDLNDSVTLIQQRALELLLSPLSIHLSSLVTKILSTITIQQQDLIKMLSLSMNNIERLHYIVIRLQNAKMLNRDNFLYGMNKICFKHPIILESKMHKISRKDSAKSHSVVIINNAIQLFIESKPNKTYNGGGVGKVKKTYTSIPDNTTLPVFGIKQIPDLDEVSELYARRGVKYNLFFNREAYYYKSKNAYNIVSTWQHGNSLAKCLIAELKKIPMIDRFQCLIDGLSNLEKLHNRFHIHGDVKPSNFIMNFAAKTMTLIDFDSTRKQGSKSTHVPFTDGFFEKGFSSENKQFCDDGYAMALTIRELFPETFPKRPNRYKKIPELNSPPLIEYALKILVISLTHVNRLQRCTIESALQFCEGVFKIDMDMVDRDIVNLLAAKTIAKYEIEVEDVIRGKMK